MEENRIPKREEGREEDQEIDGKMR